MRQPLPGAGPPPVCKANGGCLVSAGLALPAMSEETVAKVWLYEGGEWTLVEDPIPWSRNGSDEVRAKYAEAGYSEALTPGDSAEPFLVVGLHSEAITGSAAQLALFVRHEHPQCLIDIEGPYGSTRTVYATRLPDGLDLMARWAAIANAGALTALAADLMNPPTDARGWPTENGLVESVTRRAQRVLP
jgi:hypothetical protein